MMTGKTTQSLISSTATLLKELMKEVGKNGRIEMGTLAWRDMGTLTACNPHNELNEGKNKSSWVGGTKIDCQVHSMYRLCFHFTFIHC